jgi:hypothetical protein
MIEPTHTKLPGVTRVGLLLSLGCLVYCAAWIVPKSFSTEFDVIELIATNIFVRLFFGVLIVGHCFISPLLIVVGFFYYPKTASTQELLKPPFIFLLLWLSACLFPFMFLLKRDGTYLVRIFWMLPVYSVLFGSMFFARQWTLRKREVSCLQGDEAQDV